MYELYFEANAGQEKSLRSNITKMEQVTGAGRKISRLVLIILTPVSEEIVQTESIA